MDRIISYLCYEWCTTYLYTVYDLGKWITLELGKWIVGMTIMKSAFDWGWLMRETIINIRSQIMLVYKEFFFLDSRDREEAIKIQFWFNIKVEHVQPSK